MQFSNYVKPHFHNSHFIFVTSILKNMMPISSFTSAHLSSSISHVQLISETNSSTHPLDSCKSMKHLKQIHSQMIRNGDMSDPIEQSRIIRFCCSDREGDMEYARLVFDQIPEPNLVIWNTMIRGYSQRKSPHNAVVLYLEMLERGFEPDNYTFPFLLKAFNREMTLHCGKGFHAHIHKFGFDSNVFVQNALIHMYSLSGQVSIARRLFDKSCKRDVVSWNAMISGYNKIHRYEESQKLFNQMEKENVAPTAVTLVSVLSACTKLKDFECGKHVHHYVKDCRVKPTLALENALLDMYAACGKMDIALSLFETMKVRDVITWTTMVCGFTNCGQVDHARDFFNQMPERDYVSWTAMTDGYLKAYRFKEALGIFREMQAANIMPDEFTMVSILTACAQLGAREVGEWIRVYIEKNKIKKDVFVGNALIDMYSKCGDVESALKIFRKMARRDKFTWTAIILGLAVNGHGKEALDHFSRMLRASVVPDEVTYIGVLCACTHSGMVEEGRQFFVRMINDHGIDPNVSHYGCMVDLLGRAGELKEAQELIGNMPMKPNSIVWGALLGACRVHKDPDLAEMAARQIIELEPENGAVYVLLSNIYAACHRFDEMRRVRNMMVDKGVKKTPGCSLIETNGSVHEFVAGDRSHARSDEIYSKLDEMSQKLLLSGYIPDTSEALIDVGEEEKETALYQHSERLAIAFGLLNSEPGMTIRIVKNLRMCADCHRAAKLISKLYEREVVVRDRTRFHHFRHGLCSCKDYW